MSHSVAAVCLPSLVQYYTGISLGKRTLLEPTSTMALVSLLHPYLSKEDYRSAPRTPTVISHLHLGAAKACQGSIGSEGLY